MWSEPIEELVLFEFKLTGRKTGKPEEPADLAFSEE
jgi:hypothetical protein